MSAAAPVPPHRTCAWFNTDEPKLGLFSLKADGSIIIPEVPGRRRADGSGIVDVVKMQIFMSTRSPRNWCGCRPPASTA